MKKTGDSVGDDGPGDVAKDLGFSFRRCAARCGGSHPVHLTIKYFTISVSFLSISQHKCEDVSVIPGIWGWPRCRLTSCNQRPSPRSVPFAHTHWPGKPRGDYMNGQSYQPISPVKEMPRADNLVACPEGRLDHTFRDFSSKSPTCQVATQICTMYYRGVDSDAHR